MDTIENVDIAKLVQDREDAEAELKSAKNAEAYAQKKFNKLLNEKGDTFVIQAAWEAHTKASDRLIGAKRDLADIQLTIWVYALQCRMRAMTDKKN